MKTYLIKNPANEVTIAELVLNNRDEVLATALRSRKALKNWRSKSIAYRRDILNEMGNIINNNLKLLSELLTQEQGKTIIESISEISKSAELFKYYASFLNYQYERSFFDTSTCQDSLILQEPYGVVAAIIPNNYPITLLTYKIAPALAAGCTVIIKPDFQTPLTIKMLLNLFNTAGLPEDVLTLVYCEDSIADQYLIENTDIDLITFTGSASAGREILAYAASEIKKCSVELGGVNSMVVEPDCDYATSINGALYKTFRNAGQICHGISSILVHEQIFERWSNEFLSSVKKIKTGNGMEKNINMGPLTTSTRCNFITTLVEDAKNKGATIYSNFEISQSKGWFYPPTVITEVKANMRVDTEELFGPIVIVKPYDSLKNVIQDINQRETGLVTYMFGKDISKLTHYAREIQCGTIGINTVNVISFKAPFGGWKKSGIGWELGYEGLQTYQKNKHICKKSLFCSIDG